MKRILPNRLPACLFLATGLGLAVGYSQVQERLTQPEVRNFVETRAREILKAEVQVGKIRYIPPARLSLREIQISPSESHPIHNISFQGTGLPPKRGHPSFSVAHIDKLILGYGLLNLIRWDFFAPGRVILKRPQIRFVSGTNRSPVSNSLFSLAQVTPVALTVEDGEFHYPWGEGQEFILKKVHFDARPDLQGRISLKMAAQISGTANGYLEVSGFSDPQFRHYELEVRLKDIDFLPTSRIPLKKIRGKFRLTEKTMELDELTGIFHNWKLQGRGRIEDWQTLPKMALTFSTQRNDSPSKLFLEMDFVTQKLFAEWSSVGRKYPVHGEVRAEEKRILFPRLEFPHGYQGSGELSVTNGDYHFECRREKRRFQIRSNISGLNFQTSFGLDHATINHLDWTVSGRVILEPLPKTSRQDSLRFKGLIETDYLVVEYEPLSDFKGTFELDSEGVQAIDFQWGGVFHMGGRVLFKGDRPREDLVIRVDGFPLGSIRDFAGRPIPSNLQGNLEGKLKLRGEVGRPEVQGYFTIKDGVLDKLDFDQALIQFQGYPPYLKLYDSKIFRGRNTLELLGAIDLNLQNIFHGIQVKGPDSLVIWKGVSAFWKQGESAIGAEKPLGKNLSMGLEVGAGSNGKGEEPEENHAVFGPRVRF